MLNIHHSLQPNTRFLVCEVSVWDHPTGKGEVAEVSGAQPYRGKVNPRSYRYKVRIGNQVTDWLRCNPKLMRKGRIFKVGDRVTVKIGRYSGTNMEPMIVSESLVVEARRKKGQGIHRIRKILTDKKILKDTEPHGALDQALLKLYDEMEEQESTMPQKTPYQNRTKDAFTKVMGKLNFLQRDIRKGMSDRIESDIKNILSMSDDWLKRWNKDPATGKLMAEGIGALIQKAAMDFLSTEFRGVSKLGVMKAFMERPDALWQKWVRHADLHGINSAAGLATGWEMIYGGQYGGRSLMDLPGGDRYY